MKGGRGEGAFEWSERTAEEGGDRAADDAVVVVEGAVMDGVAEVAVVVGVEVSAGADASEPAGAAAEVASADEAAAVS